MKIKADDKEFQSKLWDKLIEYEFAGSELRIAFAAGFIEGFENKIMQKQGRAIFNPRHMEVANGATVTKDEASYYQKIFSDLLFVLRSTGKFAYPNEY